MQVALQLAQVRKKYLRLILINTPILGNTRFFLLTFEVANDTNDGAKMLSSP